MRSFGVNNLSVLRIENKNAISCSNQDLGPI